VKLLDPLTDPTALHPVQPCSVDLLCHLGHPSSEFQKRSGMWRPLFALSFAWPGLYAVLTHLAVALYVTALANLGLLGKFGRASFIILGTIAAASAHIGFTTRNPTIAQAFYPFMIPAVPFLLPNFIGVSLVRSAGDPAS
jgi:hypothetical protein